jgi:predicted transposase/invertase (TIGR01784 family)
LGLAEILLRHAYTRDFIKYLSIITKAFIGATSDNLGEHLFGCALAYIYNARECEEAQALTIELKSNLSNYEELIMTYAEHLRQEGMQKGMQQGRQEGMQQGMQKGMQQGMQQGMQKGMQEGMQKGMQQGRQEGVIQASLDIARSLLQAGVDKSIIKQTTHLTDEELKQLII